MGEIDEDGEVDGEGEVSGEGWRMRKGEAAASRWRLGLCLLCTSSGHKCFRWARGLWRCSALAPRWRRGPPLHGPTATTWEQLGLLGKRARGPHVGCRFPGLGKPQRLPDDRGLLCKVNSTP